MRGCCLVREDGDYFSSLVREDVDFSLPGKRGASGEGGAGLSPGASLDEPEPRAGPSLDEPRNEEALNEPVASVDEPHKNVPQQGGAGPPSKTTPQLSTADPVLFHHAHTLLQQCRAAPPTFRESPLVGASGSAGGPRPKTAPPRSPVSRCEMYLRAYLHFLFQAIQQLPKVAMGAPAPGAASAHTGATAGATVGGGTAGGTAGRSSAGSGVLPSAAFAARRGVQLPGRGGQGGRPLTGGQKALAALERDPRFATVVHCMARNARLFYEVVDKVFAIVRFFFEVLTLHRVPNSWSWEISRTVCPSIGPL